MANNPTLKFKQIGYMFFPIKSDFADVEDTENFSYSWVFIYASLMFLLQRFFEGLIDLGE